MAARHRMPKFCPEISKANRNLCVIGSGRPAYSSILISEMKKDSLHYELYGSSSAGGNGYWRWAIFIGREKKPLLVGSFFGPQANAKKHAEEAVARLKERNRKGPPPK